MTTGRRLALFAVSVVGGAGSAVVARRLSRIDPGGAHAPATEPGRVMLAAAALHGAAFALTHNSLEAARIAARSKAGAANPDVLTPPSRVRQPR